MLTATCCRIQVVADLSPNPATKSTVSTTVDFVVNLSPISATVDLVASVTGLNNTQNPHVFVDYRQLNIHSRHTSFNKHCTVLIWKPGSHHITFYPQFRNAQAQLGYREADCGFEMECFNSEAKTSNFNAIKTLCTCTLN